MIKTIIKSIFSTNTLPVFGGATGAISGVGETARMFPTWEAVIYCMVISLIGALIGYGVKLALDCIFKKKD